MLVINDKTKIKVQYKHISFWIYQNAILHYTKPNVHLLSLKIYLTFPFYPCSVMI